MDTPNPTPDYAPPGATNSPGATPAPPPPSSRTRGEGESLLTIRREAHLIERAIRNGWPIPPEQRELAMRRARELMMSESHKDWTAGIKLSIAADMANVARERIASQEKATTDRTQVEAMKAFLASLSDEERAQLNRLTLRGQQGAAPPPGGFIAESEGGEGVQPPAVATSFQDQPASLTEPPSLATENQDPPAKEASGE